MLKDPRQLEKELAFEHVDIVNKIKVITDQATGKVITISPQ